MFLARLRSLPRLVGALALLVAVTACSSLPRTPYTEADATMGLPMGIPHVRIWADGSMAELAPALRQFRAARDRAGFRDYSIMAISGGGEDGAYGAGLLNGWSEQGSRPREFSVVTGVSTGALIAPFAFLGSAYDHMLTEVYTQTDFNDILSGNPIAGLFREGVYSTDPLRRMVAKYVDAAFLARVAEEHRKGRRLLVLTTNLDAQRPVMWDMGAIADSGNPRSVDLFRRVLVGSASIPGAFEPMMIDVVRDGRTFQEMHVDGGTTMQVLAVPTKVAAAGGDFVGTAQSRSFYVLLNKKFSPDFDLTKRSTFAIAARGFDTLMKSDTYGTVLDSYRFAQKFKYKFQLGFIPDSFTMKEQGVFERSYMNALYQVGYEAGRRGGDWHDVPPGLYN
ncbi:alpha/beta hydrolase [Starkeya sp. ORNL1]|uniref:patatin-like phospholipase family protein n=1 Tax=Starkeya sp. ORNL1 TaxID=2709380 RepID=UPI001462E195|nr:patatin-like phospholipase family protein [Starkeya sp. ORNL1]QJP15153.1 alpha/beta hydrolase [Starkeya sp. ORNL1]